MYCMYRPDTQILSYPPPLQVSIPVSFLLSAGPHNLLHLLHKWANLLLINCMPFSHQVSGIDSCECLSAHMVMVCEVCRPMQPPCPAHSIGRWCSCQHDSDMLKHPSWPHSHPFNILHPHNACGVHCLAVVGASLPKGGSGTLLGINLYCQYPLLMSLLFCCCFNTPDSCLSCMSDTAFIHCFFSFFFCPDDRMPCASLMHLALGLICCAVMLVHLTPPPPCTPLQTAPAVSC